jgi:hypothetical protein
MTNSNNTTTGNTAVAILSHVATFNFKYYKQATDGFERLSALLTDGKVTEDEIETVLAPEFKDATPEVQAANTQYRRKQLKLSIPVPSAASIVATDTLTAAQTEHLQYLINAAIEAAHKPTVDSGSNEILEWSTILEEAPKQRASAVKVTMEMVEAATLILKGSMVTLGTAPKGADLVEMLAGKKFGVGAVQRVPVEVLEKVQAIVAECFLTVFTEDERAEHAAVMELWSKNLEKAIKPEATIDVSIF